MIAKYIVFNTNKTTNRKYSLPVAQGDDLNELLRDFHGKAYQIMQVKSLSDREGRYSRDQVREILLRFSKSIDVEADVDFNWEEEPEIVGYNLIVDSTTINNDEDMEFIVDEFMESEK